MLLYLSSSAPYFGGRLFVTATRERILASNPGPVTAAAALSYCF